MQVLKLSPFLVKLIKNVLYMSLKSKKLLVIGHRYSNFQKDPIDLVSEYFSHVSVLVRINKFAEVSKYFPTLGGIQSFSSNSKIDYTNKPLNLEVYKTSIFYLPFDSQYQKLGKKHLSVVGNVISNNNLKFDLIHSHFTWSSGYIGSKLKEKYGVPFVVTAHGYDIYKLPFKNEVWKKKIEYVLNSADYIITVSNSNLKCIDKLNVNTPVKVLPNGYRDDLFYPQDPKECRIKLGLPLNLKILLTVGNLVEIKGHSLLIKAMEGVVRCRKDVLCIIVGSGNLKKNLEKQISTAKLNNYVKLVGEKPHHEIPLWMNACDVFVLPSLRESFGVVQVEAMACGKPVVATYNGGSDEIVTTDEYGFLCEPANSSELMNNILRALNKKWNDLTIMQYADKFSWNKIRQEMLKIYLSLL